MVLERLMPPLHRFCVHLTGDEHLGEDLAQDTMLRAWKHRSRLRDEGGATPWLFRIARNAWLDDRRRARIRRRSASRVAREPDNARPGPAEVGDDVRLVLEALAELPGRQREVLFLSAMEDLSHEQIATVLDISTGAVKASLSLARKRVGEVLDGGSERPRKREEALP